MIRSNSMEFLDAGGNAGQKKRRHLNKTLKWRHHLKLSKKQLQFLPGVSGENP
jgi:hypothetical protein